MKTFLSVLTWASRLIIFLFIFLLALKNSALVSLQFFLGHSWEAPLALVILFAFVAGVLLGILCMVGALFRERRAVARLRRDQANAEKAGQQPNPTTEH